MGKDSFAERDDREEVKKYDDDVIGIYKVKHVHGSDSLKFVGRILIDRSFLLNYFLQTHHVRMIQIIWLVEQD